MADTDAVSLWNGALANLREMLTPDNFERWIAGIRLSGVKEQKLFLAVDNEFFKDWLENNFRSVILEALYNADAPDGLDLVFFVQAQEEEPAPPPEVAERKARSARKSKPAVENATLNPLFTFEAFVVGPSNSFAYAAVEAVAGQPGRAYNPLFIYGGTGLGKTHLIQAAGHKLQEVPGAQVRYVTTETLLNEYVESIQKRSTVEFRTRYRNVDLLIVDDIHFLAGKNALQEEFFHTFNALHQSGRQIIMTSDRPANEIEGLEQRLVSRFEWGLVTQLEMPDFETRLAILRHKQRTAAKPLDDSILTFIAQNVKSNVRTLEGALMRAISYVSLHKGAMLSVEVLRGLLRDLLDREQAGDLSIDEIQKTVAEFYHIRLHDITSPKRMQSITFPRQIAMFLSRKLTQKSLPEIAKAFDKTHATILHGCKAVQDRLSVEDDLRESLRVLTRKLNRDPATYNI